MFTIVALVVSLFAALALCVLALLGLLSISVGLLVWAVADAAILCLWISLCWIAVADSSSARSRLARRIAPAETGRHRRRHDAMRGVGVRRYRRRYRRLRRLRWSLWWAWRRWCYRWR